MMDHNAKLTDLARKGRGLENQISYLKAKMKQYESQSRNSIRLNGEKLSLILR